LVKDSCLGIIHWRIQNLIQRELNGNIEHNFGDWKLDLAIGTKRLLVLNTVDKEDDAYYGTAFIDGNATITGPANGLFIRVVAQSEKGTS
jgi:hypothetical protein